MKEDILEQSVAQKILRSVLYHYGLTVSDLMSKLNLSGTTMLYDINSGKTKSTSKKFVDLLKGLYPELNEVYLRTGRGEMLITPSAEIKKEEPPTNDMSGVLLHLVSVIHEQSQLISELNKKVSALTLQVASLQPQPVRPYLFNENESSAFAADDSKPENQ